MNEYQQDYLPTSLLFLELPWKITFRNLTKETPKGFKKLKIHFDR